MPRFLKNYFYYQFKLLILRLENVILLLYVNSNTEKFLKIVIQEIYS